jgi:hypothetical protein
MATPDTGRPGDDERLPAARSPRRVRIPVIRRHQATQIGAAARAVAQRTPETLTVVRQRAQPTVATIIRLTLTAVFAYVVALQVPGTSGPVLAPLTALLVAQVTLYQTLRSAIRRVASVVAGVLLAVGLSALVGFTWWSLGVTVAAALTLGYVLRLGEHLLEVPISAMLVLSVGSQSAATSRIVETFIGAGAGLAAGLVLASPKVEPAEEAIAGLCRRTADLLDQMAAGLTDGSVGDASVGWLAQARALGGEIRRVDDALRQAEESTRLNPRSLRLPYATVSLRDSLETLEHAAITVRGLARTLTDSARLGEDGSPLTDPGVRSELAAVLRELDAAVRTYGRLATEHDPSRHEQLESGLDAQLAAAEAEQDRLSELLGTDPAARPVGWPLRGELISHLDRIRIELAVGKPESRRRPRRIRSWRRPLRAGWRAPRSPTRRRLPK